MGKIMKNHDQPLDLVSVGIMTAGPCAPSLLSRMLPVREANAHGHHIFRKGGGGIQGPYLGSSFEPGEQPGRSWVSVGSSDFYPKLLVSWLATSDFYQISIRIVPSNRKKCAPCSQPKEKPAVESSPRKMCCVGCQRNTDHLIHDVPRCSKCRGP